MVRILGFASLFASIFLIGVKVGWEIAKYHESPKAFVDAVEVRLSIGEYVGD